MIPVPDKLMLRFAMHSLGMLQDWTLKKTLASHCQQALKLYQIFLRILSMANSCQCEKMREPMLMTVNE